MTKKDQKTSLRTRILFMIYMNYMYKKQKKDWYLASPLYALEESNPQPSGP